MKLRDVYDSIKSEPCFSGSIFSLSKPGGFALCNEVQFENGNECFVVYLPISGKIFLLKNRDMDELCDELCDDVTAYVEGGIDSKLSTNCKKTSVLNLEKILSFLESHTMEMEADKCQY